jgi:hypothetical protein
MVLISATMVYSNQDSVEVKATIGSHTIYGYYEAATIHASHEPAFDPVSEWDFHFIVTSSNKDQLLGVNVGPSYPEYVYLIPLKTPAIGRKWTTSTDTSFHVAAQEMDGPAVSYTSQISFDIDLEGDLKNEYNYANAKVGDVTHYVMWYIRNEAPTLSISGPEHVYRGDTVSVTATASDPEGDLVTYVWKDPNGNWIDTGQNPTFDLWAVPNDPSEVGKQYTIACIAQDWLFEQSDIMYFTFTVENRPPSLNPLDGPYVGGVPVTEVYRGDYVEFHISGNDAPENDYPFWYKWYINDFLMQEGTGLATFGWLHTMESWSVGTHEIKVEVYDSLGAMSEASKLWTTYNHPPTISVISGPTSGYRGIAYTWTATGSDVEGDSLTYEWYVDGTWVSGGSSLVHAFGTGDALGPHTVSVRVQDVIGDYSDFSVLTFTLTDEPNDPPIISEISGPDSATVGDTCTFSVSASDPDGDLPLTITWYLNGTSQDIGTSFTYTFDSETAGEYLIQARAQDSRGASSSIASLMFTLNEETGPFYRYFNVTFEEETYVVETCSNSSVTDFAFNQGIKRIRFNATGAAGMESFCNITIPAELLSGDFTIFIDDVELVEGEDYTITSNSTHNTLCINYAHSSHMVDVFGTMVIPEFASWLVLPFLMSATLLGLALRRRLKKLRYSS